MHFNKPKILLANTFSMEAIEKMSLSKIAKRTEEDLHEWNTNCVSNVVYRCLLRCKGAHLGISLLVKRNKLLFQNLH